MLDSESSLTCGLRSDEGDVKAGCKNVKIFIVEPLMSEKTTNISFPLSYNFRSVSD